VRTSGQRDGLAAITLVPQNREPGQAQVMFWNL